MHRDMHLHPMLDPMGRRLGSMALRLRRVQRGCLPTQVQYLNRKVSCCGYDESDATRLAVYAVVGGSATVLMQGFRCLC